MRRPSSSHPAAGYVMVLSAAVLFATNGSMSKLVLGSGLPAERLTELRSAGALVVLLGICVARNTDLRVPVRDLPMLAFYGVVGFAMVQWLYLLAIDRLPVGIGLLFEFTAPVLVAAWARLVQRRPVRRRVWAALVLSLAGLTMVAEVWGDARLDLGGIGAGLLSAMALAVFFLVGEHRVATHDPDALTFWGFVFATLFWTVAQPWWTFPGDALSRPVPLGEVPATLPVWVLMIGVVLVGTVAPFLLSMHALRHLPATTVGVVAMSEPVIAGIVAWLVLGEGLGNWQLVGGAIVLTGIGLAQTARVPTAPPSAPVAPAAGRGGHGEAAVGTETDAPPMPTT